MRKGLQKIFEQKDWGNKPGIPRSGDGSTMENTERLRAAFPRIFKDYNVKTFLDAPCGDWFWMQHVDLDGMTYIGGDISHELIEENKSKYDADGREFMHLDITSDALPEADMIMCRDCMFHLKFWLRWAFFENFAKSNIPYLLMTMHHQAVNKRLHQNGGFFRFNPLVEPFNFEDPLEIICETQDELPADIYEREDAWKERSLGIWSREQVARAVDVRQEVLAKIKAEEEAAAQ